MSRRKPRPLTREQSDFRDDRLFIIACDDTHAPAQYFSFFKMNKVKVHVVPTLDGKCSSQHVLERLCDIDFQEDDERWLLLDTDHYVNPRHVKTFRGTLREAAQKGVNVALSRPCFEIWLLLHHMDEHAVCKLEDAQQAVAALRAAINAYDKTKLNRINFTEEGVLGACQRSYRLDKSVGDELIPGSTTTRVYKLWLKILDAIPDHMLSRALRELKNAKLVA